jgi:hypothetical protein
MKTYKEFKGMFFSEETSNEVCTILQAANEYGWRIRIFYGDVSTGKNWNEEYYTIGNVGKSTGNIKIPLLIKTKRSNGGCSILDNCILKIIDIRTNKVLYQHAKYKPDNFICLYKNISSDEAIVCINEESNLYANCETMNKAVRLCNFMNGLKHSK